MQHRLLFFFSTFILLCLCVYCLLSFIPLSSCSVTFFSFDASFAVLLSIRLRFSPAPNYASHILIRAHPSYFASPVSHLAPRCAHLSLTCGPLSGLTLAARTVIRCDNCAPRASEIFTAFRPHAAPSTVRMRRAINYGHSYLSTPSSCSRLAALRSSRERFGVPNIIWHIDPSSFTSPSY